MIQLHKCNYNLTRIHKEQLDGDEYDYSDEDDIIDNYSFNGIPIDDIISVGNKMCILTITKVFCTGEVKSIYQEGSDYFDKLILPSTFTGVENLELPTLKINDILFTTVDSIYLLSLANE